MNQQMIAAGERVAPKRRACLALQSLIEAIAQQGTRTLLPEFVIEQLIRLSEDPQPERMLSGADRWRFWRKLTLEELMKLIDEYESVGAIDDLMGARAELDNRQRSR